MTTNPNKIALFFSRHRNGLLIGSVLLLAFGLRIFGFDFGLPTYIYHTDESMYLAEVIAWWQGNGSQIFSRNDFPSIFFLVLYGLVGITYRVQSFFHGVTNISEVPLTTFAYWGRIISVLVSTISVWLTYRLGKQMFNRAVGLFSALVLAVMFIDVQVSHYIKHDVYAQMFGLLAVYFSWLFMKRSTWYYIPLAVVAVVAAGTIKHSGFLFIMPLVVALIIKYYDIKARATEKTKKIYRGALILIPGIALLVMIVIWLTRYSAGNVMDLFLQPFSDTQTAASNENGQLNWIWWPQYFLMAGVYYPTVLAIIGGFILLLRNFNRKILFLFAFPAVYLVILLTQAARFDRWAVLLTPFLAIVGGYFLYWLYSFSRAKKTRWNLMFSTIIIIILILIPAIRIVLFDYTISQIATQELAVTDIKNKLKPDEILLTYGAPDVLPLLSAKAPELNIDEVQFWPMESQSDILRYSGEYIVVNKSLYNVAKNYQQTERYQETYQTLSRLLNDLLEKDTFSYPLFENEFFGPHSLEHGATANNYHQPTLYLFKIPEDARNFLPPIEETYFAHDIAMKEISGLSDPIELSDGGYLSLDKTSKNSLSGFKKLFPRGTYSVTFAMAAVGTKITDRTIGRVAVSDTQGGQVLVQRDINAETIEETDIPDVFTIELPLELQRARFLDFSVTAVEAALSFHDVNIKEQPLDRAAWEKWRVIETPRHTGVFDTAVINEFSHGTIVKDAETGQETIYNSSTSGPYNTLIPGNYQAIFSVRVNNTADQNCLSFDVVRGGNSGNLGRVEKVGDTGNDYTDFVIDFSVSEMMPIEARLIYSGCGDVWLQKIEIKQKDD